MTTRILAAATVLIPAALVSIVLTPTAAFGQSSLSNDFLAVDVNDTNGDFALRTTGGVDGDALAGDDNDKILLFGSGWSGDTIVDVDGGLWLVSGTAPDGTVADPAAITQTWTNGDITLVREYRLTMSSSGNPDLLRISTRLQNAGAVNHVLGLMVGLDTMIGDNDGAPLFSNSGIIEFEEEFSGAAIPTSWQAFEVDDVANPGLTAMGVLSGGDATAPDRFIMGNWPSGLAREYDHVASGEAIYLYNDTAVGMWWENRTLAPGSNLEVVTYYGVGSGSTLAGDLSLNLTSPSLLTEVNGVLSPNPFDANLVIENNHFFTAINVTADLSLPAGLTLVGGDASALVGDILPGDTALVSWQIEATPPAPGSPNEIYTFSVDVGADNDPGPYSLSRDVEVPALTALDGLDVTIHTTSPADFPVVEMIVEVTDSDTGDFVDNLDETNFTVTEDGTDMQNCTVELLSQGSGASADIVFVVDITGSMTEEIEGLKNNIVSFADTLAASNIDYTLGLITYSESVFGQFGMTADVNEFRSWVQAVTIESGADENPLDAIAAVPNLGLREDVDRIVILATDETYGLHNTTLAQAGQILSNNGLRLHAVTDASLNADYDALVTPSGGSFFDILLPFETVLDEIGEEILNRYKIRCDTPNPARDNTWRDVNVAVLDGFDYGEDDDEYFIEGGALRIEPTFAAAAVGDDLALDVVADSIGGLHSSHVVISYDPSYLQFVSVDAGELLGRDSSSGTVPSPTVNLGVDNDASAGRLSFNVARNHSEGTNGSGVLAQLVFTLTAQPPEDSDGNGNVDDTLVDDMVFEPSLIYLTDGNLGQVSINSYSDCDVDSLTPSLLGDFDRDGDIDLIDFSTLAANWGSTTATVFGATGGDIAPVSGNAPNLVAQPDGLVDYLDLFVFTRMWNWYRYERVP